MYQRFLRNNDYLSLITKEALQQLIRGDESRMAEAEMSAEMSMVEYLTENFEIEKVLAEGKAVTDYNKQITYPVNSHFILDDVYYRVIKSISGCLRPTSVIYWKLRDDITESEGIQNYLQLSTYQPKDLVMFNDLVYECLEANGLEFDNIQMPNVIGWTEAKVTDWKQIPYDLWAVVEYESKFYTLMTKTDYDYLATPVESDCWGLIGNYSILLNNYQLSNTEYVVSGDKVYYPIVNVNADVPTSEVNIYPDDPRNLNVKKHMLQLSLYELHKLISPNNISTVRVTDYENSIQWLRDASRLKLNPQIPRKIDKEDGKPVLDWQVATFQRDYNPYENPWQI